MAGRKKLDRTSLHARVAPQTADKIKEIASILGYVYDNEGSTGQLLDAIANGKIILISAEKNAKAVDTFCKVVYNCNNNKKGGDETDRQQQG